MGYRVLLKRYMQQLRSKVGSDFVEELVDERGGVHKAAPDTKLSPRPIAGAESSALSKRDIGELRSIAAELNREAHNYDDYDLSDS